VKDAEGAGIEKAGQATLGGDVFDDTATGRRGA
jgi:hypothetical protein